MLPSSKVLDLMDQDEDSSLLVAAAVTGVSSNNSTSTTSMSTRTAKAKSNMKAHIYDDDLPSPRWGDYFNKFEESFEIQRSSFNSLSSVSPPLTSMGSCLKNQALADQAQNEIQPHKSLQSSRLAKRLPLEDYFDSDDEESKPPGPNAILSLPKQSSSNANKKLEPIAYHFKSTTTDNSQHSSSKGRSEQLQVRAMLENSPPAVKGPTKVKLSSAREKMGETRQGKNHPPPAPHCRELLVSSSPRKTQSKPVGNMMMMYNSMNRDSDRDRDDAADQPLLPAPSPPPSTKSYAISHLSSTAVKSRSSEEATSKDNDREVLDDDDDEQEEQDNNKNNKEEVEDGKGAAKRQLVAANPSQLGKSYGCSLSLPDVTTTTPSSFDTVTSPQRLRRGKKPGNKLIPMSPTTTPIPQSPPTCRHHHCDPKKNKNVQHRSTSCDQPLDRICHRSQSTSKSTRGRSSSQSNPHEIEVMESRGQDNQTTAMARSRSHRSSASDSFSTKHLNGTDNGLPSGHQDQPLPGLRVSSHQGSTERASSRIDSPSSPHYQGANHRVPNYQRAHRRNPNRYVGSKPERQELFHHSVNIRA